LPRRDAPDLSIAAAVDEHEWDAYVLSHPDATGHHRWRWRRVIEETFGQRTEYFAVRRGERLVGVLPLVRFRSFLFGRSLISLPFLNYGGVLADDEAAGRALLREARRVALEERARHIELRHRRRHFAELPVRAHKVAMVKRLPDSAEQAWSGLDRKVRNQVRKAQKSGLQATWGGLELVTGFYSVFAENMRDLGTPVYSRRLFESALQHFAGDVTLLLVHLGPEVVAGGVVSTFRDTVEVHWAASRQCHRSLCPNHILYWTVIEWATKRGLQFLDFGRSTPGEGTYNFKAQWGAEAEALYWEYVLVKDAEPPDHGPTNPAFALAIQAWKRLPLVVSNTIGPSVVRGIP
jgi:FemAB-related protein (PEP-CTERM system-associated)